MPDGTYRTSLQTYEPLLTHEFQHVADCCKPDNQRPADSFPPDELRLKDLFTNPMEQSAVAAENKLRCYCTELKLPLRSSYIKPHNPVAK